MSSPAQRRASSRAQSNGTPQPVRQNVASSSPLFFGSSQNGTPRGSANGAPNGNPNPPAMEMSSPLKQASLAGSTPRGRAPGGKRITPFVTMSLTGPQKSRLPFTMPQAQAPRELQHRTHHSVIIYTVIAVAYLSALPNRRRQEHQG